MLGAIQASHSSVALHPYDQIEHSQSDPHRRGMQNRVPPRRSRKYSMQARRHPLQEPRGRVGSPPPRVRPTSHLTTPPDKEFFHWAFLALLGRRILNHLDQLARLPRQRGDHPPRRDRLAGVKAVLQGVPVALRSAAACAVHPADAIPSHGRRSARLPAPLRCGVASQRLVHRPMHGVAPRLSCAPPPPRRAR